MFDISRNYVIFDILNKFCYYFQYLAIPLKTLYLDSGIRVIHPRSGEIGCAVIC